MRHYVLICHEIDSTESHHNGIDIIQGVYSDFHKACERFNLLQDQVPHEAIVGIDPDGEEYFNTFIYYWTYRLEVWEDLIHWGNVRRVEAMVKVEPRLSKHGYVCPECNCSEPTHKQGCSLYEYRIGDVICKECGLINGHTHSCSLRHQREQECSDCEGTGHTGDLASCFTCGMTGKVLTPR